MTSGPMPPGRLSYRAGQLAGMPSAVSVLERAPRVLPPIARPDLPEIPLAREDLIAALHLGTGSVDVGAPVRGRGDGWR
ncbi:hypothetical protein [Micromonospora psammae]|uniref:hypothetical protein n=1 Tax=Micromonospora sp. CPCC 205556 TaxID=3122398 RepID=UPI002FEFA7E0